TDLPGTYSLFPNSKDEQIVYDTLKNAKNFDVIVYVLDANNLERNLLFFSQLYDLGLPLILAVTMNDIVKRKGKTINFDTLKKTFSDIEIVQINPRVGFGIDRLKGAIQNVNYDKQTDFYSSEIQSITLENKTAQQADTTN